MKRKRMRNVVYRHGYQNPDSDLTILRSYDLFEYNRSGSCKKLLIGLKLMNVERSFAEKHYEDLSAKPFFNGLVEYIVSGSVVAMVWEGKDVVATGRKIIGATNPSESAPGTIRGDFAVEIGRYVAVI
ncbi:hypothetical protein TEA_016181 [Camellia sinensis var. sinensis]|uniref:Nucleoside diphosphate kinase, mitochondrial n=1 Tax=Camellia sinensis var. sinensis TaxID=542762 RepID=A0A4S4EI70_CAMSN|nr:hypothetical protein TEA_016181 [Camellia sinensis var. sinensis]